MKIPTLCAIIISITAASLSSTSAQTLLFDFGSTNSPGFPGSDGNYWNVIPNGTAMADDGIFFGAVTSLNDFTSIQIEMQSRFNGENQSGTTASSLSYPVPTTQDSMFGNTEIFSGLSDIFPSFKLTGLDLGSAYDITFYASRLGVADNRETLYTVGSAAGSTSTSLNVANNVDGTTSLFGLTPVDNGGLGEITISLSPGPNNNNGNHFTYLGVLQVDTVPEPSSIALLIGGAGLALIRRRRA